MRERELLQQLTDLQGGLEAASAELRQVSIRGLAQSRLSDSNFRNNCPDDHVMGVDVMNAAAPCNGGGVGNAEIPLGISANSCFP